MGLKVRARGLKKVEARKGRLNRNRKDSSQEGLRVESCLVSGGGERSPGLSFVL